MMNNYATDWAIDSIQNTKKYYVKTLVQDTALAAPMNSFIDAQTLYTKSVVKSIFDMTDAVSKMTGNWLSLKN